MEVEEEKLHTDKGILDRCRVLPLYRSRLEEKKKKYVNELDPSLMRREKERDHEHGLKKNGRADAKITTRPTEHLISKENKWLRGETHRLWAMGRRYC